MIIVNGEICAKVKTGGGLDENGNPIRPSESWEAPIPCHIRSNTYNNKGKANGNTFTVASYEVLIESQPFVAERVKLTDRNGKDLGEFSVMEIEYLDAVDTVKITV